MKNIFLSLSCILLISLTATAQIIADGQIDITINLPIPEVVIIQDNPIPAPKPHPTPEIIIIDNEEPYPSPKHVPRRYTNSQGTIMNQNGPFDGRIDYQVVSTNLSALNQGEELSFTFDSGDVLSMVILTAQPNDFNYHYCTHCKGQKNAIVDVKLNGHSIAMRDASLSLHLNNQHFTAVVNVHSLDEGDFNGTVHF